MSVDHAETANIEKLISRIGAGLDQFLKFEHEDCWRSESQWRAHLDVPMPHQGVGIAVWLIKPLAR
jgi:aromatic-L-amino-acid decarboxylase